MMTRQALALAVLLAALTHACPLKTIEKSTGGEGAGVEEETQPETGEGDVTGETGETGGESGGVSGGETQEGEGGIAGEEEDAVDSVKTYANFYASEDCSTGQNSWVGDELSTAFVNDFVIVNGNYDPLADYDEGTEVDERVEFSNDTQPNDYLAIQLPNLCSCMFFWSTGFYPSSATPISSMR